MSSGWGSTVWYSSLSERERKEIETLDRIIQSCSAALKAASDRREFIARRWYQRHYAAGKKVSRKEKANG